MQQDIFCQWQYNQAKRRLVVLLPSKNIITTTLSDKHLASQHFQPQSCSLADFSDYNLYHKLLLACGFEAKTAEILAYSAVATQHFLLPSQPKSWFFQPLNTEEFGTIQPQSLARLYVKQTQQWAMVLICHIDETVANGLWLENDLNLPGLTLSFGEPFRIFVDRLQPIAIDLNLATQYYQQSA